MSNKKILIICFSFHHGNTLKIAKVIAKQLDAIIKKPTEIKPEDIKKYDIIGFGSGIDSDRHYKPIYNLIDKLPNQNGKKTFSFCTSGTPIKFLGKKFFYNYTKKCTDFLEEKLKEKKFTIIDSFSCPGFNTNLFLKYIGGTNKYRPNEEDLKNAKDFALKIKDSF
jgi:flavodoxin